MIQPLYFGKFPNLKFTMKDILMNPNKQLAPHILLYAVGYYIFLTLIFISQIILNLFFLLIIIIAIRTSMIIGFILVPFVKYLLSDLLFLINGIRLRSNNLVEVEITKQDASNIFNIIDGLKHHMGIKY